MKIILIKFKFQLSRAKVNVKGAIGYSVKVTVAVEENFFHCSGPLTFKLI